MMAMTTRSSMSVKPLSWYFRAGRVFHRPLEVGRSVRGGTGGAIVMVLLARGGRAFRPADA